MQNYIHFYYKPDEFEAPLVSESASEPSMRLVMSVEPELSFEPEIPEESVISVVSGLNMASRAPVKLYMPVGLAVSVLLGRGQ